MPSEPWEQTQQTHRHIPHKSTNRRGKKTSSFDPRNAFGTYEIQCPTIQKHYDVEALTMDIHGMTEDGLGMEASFDFGVLVGMMLVAGSRKRLREVVEGMEEEESEDREEEEEGEGDGDGTEEEEEEEGDGVGKGDEDVKTGEADDVLDAENADDLADTDDEHGEDSIAEPAQSRSRKSKSKFSNHAKPSGHSDHPFEKNTFRRPKFWLQWRGIDKTTDDTAVVADPLNLNRGFIEFSNNACRDFKGTFTSELLGEDVAFQGFRVRSKGSVCPFRWGDVGFRGLGR